MCPPQVYVSPKYERWREPEISPLEKCPFRVASRRTCPRCYHRNRARLCQELNAPKELRKRKSTLPRDGGSSASGMRQQQQRQSRGSRLTASQRPASSSFERMKKRRGAGCSVGSDRQRLFIFRHSRAIHPSIPDVSRIHETAKAQKTRTQTKRKKNRRQIWRIGVGGGRQGQAALYAPRTHHCLQREMPTCTAVGRPHSLR